MAFPRKIGLPPGAAHIDPKNGDSDTYPVTSLSILLRMRALLTPQRSKVYFTAGNTMDCRCIFLTLFAVGLVPSFTDAQVSSPGSVVPDAANSDVVILVLVDGRLLNGHCLPRPDGYDIQVPGGRMFVESQRVRFIAKSMEDAYQRMRDSYPLLTPEVHLELAQWCTRNKMPEQARREVLDALRLDPNRLDAKRMLETMVAISADPSGRTSGSGLTEYPSTRQTLASPMEARSLAGLSRPVAQSFTRHVQPLLMNKCANGGCHGGGHTSSFHLVSAHRGTNTSIAERNLAAVLKQINFSDAASSPLLSGINGTHGGLTTPIFRGRSGNQQLNLLRDWVRMAANDIAPETAGSDAAAQEDEEFAGSVSLASANVTDSGQSKSDSTTGLSVLEQEVQMQPTRKISTAETDAQFLKQAARARNRDAFDPSVFNSRFHSPAASVVSPQTSESIEQTGNSGSTGEARSGP